jgi:hypothetical protein
VIAYITSMEHRLTRATGSADAEMSAALSTHGAPVAVQNRPEAWATARRGERGSDQRSAGDKETPRTYYAICADYEHRGPDLKSPPGADRATTRGSRSPTRRITGVAGRIVPTGNCQVPLFGQWQAGLAALRGHCDTQMCGDITPPSSEVASARILRLCLSRRACRRRALDAARRFVLLAMPEVKPERPGRIAEIH